MKRKAILSLLLVTGVVWAQQGMVHAESKPEVNSPLLFTIETQTSPLKNVLGQEENPPHTSTKKQKPEKIVYTVKEGDTLSKIAKRYDTTVNRLFYKNKKIVNPDVIKPGFKITIPNPSEKLKKRAESASIASRRMIKPISFPGSFRGFDWGWCTYYAQLSRPDKSFRGDAAQWMAFANGSTPRVGAVAVSTTGYYGHVAIVIGIKGDQIKVRHMNWRGFGVVSEDWVAKSYWSGYIY